MKVFKFGGASVKDASGVRNVALILRKHATAPILVVVSAMGQTTNALERVLDLFVSRGDYHTELAAIKQYHLTIIQELFPGDHPIWEIVEQTWDHAEQQLHKHENRDLLYDQFIAYGEILSTLIVFHYAAGQRLPVDWIDARNYILTDDTFREAVVDWTLSCQRIQALKKILLEKTFVITQGFIAGTSGGLTTTLGRDGSDFSAAIFGSCLDVESVTIWKDVPGVMSADPKRMEAAAVFEELPFREAAEMTYYGASVIHPKTIKPLATKGIPLHVKSFDDPALPGTKIHECHVEHIPPLVVFKDNQCLVSCKVTDYAFITEEHMSRIFTTLTELNVRINMMQNSAISFSFCIDFRESKLVTLVKHLQTWFEVYYNTGLTLITVKNYDDPTFDSFRRRPGILLEQSSRSTLQVLVRQ